MDHTGLAVAGLDAAESWYCNAFGYVVELRLAVDEIALHIVMLRHPQHGDRLELLHRTGSAPGSRFTDPAQAALAEGFGHIAFDVEDLDATYVRLLTLGATSVVPPQASPEPGVRMAFLADPEGNLVEILSREPVVTGLQAGSAGIER
jgi:glyoxylase I family protein